MAGEVERLSGKLGIDTTDFKTALAAANRELRVLETGFKASAAALGDWTKDATGLESRVKSLTSQIDVQKLKVAALTAEHERLVQENGENSRAAQDAEIKLNKETETLNKMQNELSGTEAALEEMQSGEEETGDAAEEMGEKVEESGSKVDTLKGVLGGMGAAAGLAVTAIAALGAAAIAAVGAIGALVFNAAEAAGELVDLSAQTGISTTRLQELAYIGDQVGTSSDTMTSSLARLVRSMSSAQDQQEKFDDALAEGKMEDEIHVPMDMAAAFNQLGVAFTDSGGNLRDNEAVFADVIDALGQVSNESERDALSMQIFGKSAQELNPLIKAGSAEMSRLAQQAHDVGAVMSEEDVAALEAFDDSMASLQAGVKGTLGTLAAEFLPVAQLVASALQDLFKSDEFKRGVQEFTRIIEGVVKVTTQVMKQLLSGDLKGALTTLFGADAAAQLLPVINAIRSFISDTLIPFVTTHAEEIKAALIGIGAAFAAAGIVAIIAAIIAAINPVTLIIAGIAAAVGLLSAAWAGNWLGIRDVAGAVWEFLQSIFNNWISYLDLLRSAWQDVLLPALQAVWGFLSGSVFPLFQAIGQFIGAVFDLYLRVLAGLWQNVLLPALQTVWGFLSANIFPIFQTIGGYVSGTFQPVLDKLGSFLKSTLVPAFSGISKAIETVTGWLKKMADMINNLKLPSWLTPGSPTPWELGLIGITEAIGELNKQLPAMAIGLDRVSFAGASSIGNPSQVSSSSTQNDNFSFYAPVIVQGSTQPQSLGARLKGRRY